MDIHELYEIPNHNQDEVLEIQESEKKISRPVSDPLALVADKRYGQSSRPLKYENLQNMKKAVALLTRYGQY